VKKKMQLLFCPVTTHIVAVDLRSSFSTSKMQYIVPTIIHEVANQPIFATNGVFHTAK